jgi:hypothetical protein
VHVGVGVGGRIDVDHQLDAGYVDAASRHVGRNQRLDRPIAERIQRARPLCLWQLSAEGLHREAVCGELLRE